MNASFRLLIGLFSLLISGYASGQPTLPTNIIPFASGFTDPVCITHAGDSRLFVVSQNGFIFVADSLGNVNPQPFLDLHNSIVYGGEQGLLGLAFHPQYASNGYFYLYYTGQGDSLHVDRYHVSSLNPNQADSMSRFKLMTLFHPFTNHNGGTLMFGPDTYLYIGTGDGGSGGDPDNRSQNPMEYLGKILRIDVNQGNPYAIPSTNPFVGVPNTLGEIWALGLRNPWKFSFDRLTGDLWIGDVGQNAIEEIDFQAAGDTGGRNYGWRCYEGNQVYNIVGCPSASNLTFPVYTYPHGPECSVTGGFVYRGNAASPYYGYYFFADYCSDTIWTLHNVSGNWVAELYGQFAGNNFSAFGEDHQGQLYVAGLTSGNIYRVVDNLIGLSENDGHNQFRILQNPFNETISFKTENGMNVKLNMTLCDANGSEIFSTSAQSTHFEIDASDMASGIYFLKLTTEGVTSVHKLIKF